MAQSTSTKSQVWSIDVIVAVIIFITALVLFYKYSINLVDVEGKDSGNLLLDGKLISSYLVSAGNPNDWEDHSEDTNLIGLTNGNMDINPQKVQEFSDLVTLDYPQSRKLLSTTHDYYVFFEDKNNNTIRIKGVGVDGIGKGYTTENQEDIIKITRLVYYNSTIIRMVLYIW